MNTEERQRLPRNARLRADAGVCPQQANTQEKTLATADLVRDTALIRTEAFLTLLGTGPPRGGALLAGNNGDASPICEGFGAVTSQLLAR